MKYMPTILDAFVHETFKRGDKPLRFKETDRARSYQRRKGTFITSFAKAQLKTGSDRLETNDGKTDPVCPSRKLAKRFHKYPLSKNSAYDLLKSPEEQRYRLENGEEVFK
ncbi:hypothetical protein GcM1_123006 [Golovinomyces cichoracearum]|uniref:Uncharacterized protein n=1 Tax=Golovinomyces cichoracearum TaxID=62708 RepID=A0A420JC30_9PEZI|nr:hypothetical protein GcM1_123006 [Golovinomyces cichoracearum]